MNHDEELDDLLDQWESDRDAGITRTAADLCHDRPDLIEPLSARILELRHADRQLFFKPDPDEYLHIPDHPSEQLFTVQTSYRIGGFHARGGLGEIHVVRDEVTGREAALKRLQPLHAHRPQRQDRFLREAVITSRLEHPGIVPIYGLGTGADGRHGYIMRLISGQTLTEAIAEFHRPLAGPLDRSSLRPLLQRFVSVCNTVAFAHSRSIVHRDLKPSNIILGPFGETLVLDWGLAKDLHSPQADADTPPAENPLSGTTLTHAGAALGTPAFASPEQRDGHLDKIGPASDVYSLGATLFTMLHGVPPVEAKKRSIPRLVPPALSAIVARAMAPVPADRYASALELAVEIEHWLSDEPVRAYRGPWTERAGRWARKHRGFLRTAAAVAVAALGILSASTVLLKQAGDRERELKVVAEENYEAARAAVDEYFLTVSQSRLASLPGAQPIRKELLELALKYYRGFIDQRADDPRNRIAVARSSSRIAMIVGEIESAAAARPWHEQALERWQRLRAEQPEDPAIGMECAGALDLASIHSSRSGRSQEALDRATEAVHILDALPDHAETRFARWGLLSRALVNLAEVQGTLGRNELAIATSQRGISIDEQILQVRPEDRRVRLNLAKKLNNIGVDWQDLGRYRDSLSALERARDILRDAPGNRTGDSEFALGNWEAQLGEIEINRGLTLFHLGRLDDAARTMATGYESMEALSARDPSVVRYQTARQFATVHLALIDLFRDRPITDRIRPLADRASGGNILQESLTQLARALDRRASEIPGLPTPKFPNRSDLALPAFQELCAMVRATTAARQGRHRDAMAILNQPVLMKTRSPMLQFQCARVLAMSPHREGSAAEAAKDDDIVRRLQRAIDSGFEGMDLIRTEQSLHPYRHRVITPNPTKPDP